VTKLELGRATQLCVALELRLELMTLTMGWSDEDKLSKVPTIKHAPPTLHINAHLNALVEAEMAEAAAEAAADAAAVAAAVLSQARAPGSLPLLPPRRSLLAVQARSPGVLAYLTSDTTDTAADDDETAHESYKTKRSAIASTRKLPGMSAKPIKDGGAPSKEAPGQNAAMLLATGEPLSRIALKKRAASIQAHAEKAKMRALRPLADEETGRKLEATAGRRSRRHSL